MAKDLLHRISERMHEFSKGQKRIGNFILEHYDKAAFMTAARLGEAVGVSESTVVRLRRSSATTAIRSFSARCRR